MVDDPLNSTPSPLAPPVAVPVGGRMRLGQAAFASIYADLLLAVASLAVVPFLVGRLGAEPYGILGIVSVLAGQLGVLHFGVGTAATRLVADSIGRGGEALVARLTGVAVVAAAASLLVGVVFLLAAPVVWRGGFNVSSGTLPLALASVPAAAALVALTPAAAAVYGVLNARERFMYLATLRVYQGLGRLLAACAVVTLGGGVAAIFWAQALVDLSAVGAGALGSWSGAPAQPVRGTAVGPRLREGVGAVLAVGAPFALVSLLAGLLTDAEKLAIAWSRSLQDFTYYAVPFNAVVKLTVISGAVVRVLMPRVGMLGARGEHEEARTLVERVDRLVVTAMAGLVMPAIACAPELLRFWVGEEFAVQSATATRILLVGVAINAAAFPAHAAVLARGRPLHLTMLYGAEVVLHLAMVYLLVTRFGLVGAAAAWSLRVALDTLAQRALARRALGARLRDWATVWGPLLLVVAFAALAHRLPLGVRVGVGGAMAAAAAVRLARGDDGRLLLDSLLPWRWGGRRVR